LLAKDEARRIAANIAKLPELVTSNKGWAMPGLIDYAATADELLSIEPEDLAVILLNLVDQIQPHSRNFTLSHFEMPLWNANSPGYPPTSRQAVARALAEAWQWLQTEGLMMPDPDQPNGWFCLTRRGERLKRPADAKAYRKSGLLPASNLHPILLEKVRPMFLRGDYDLATFEAFKQVEISVREAAGLAADLIGVDLMRKAFDASSGLLTDKSVVKAEREALSHLFAGAIGHAKNPGSHRTVDHSAIEAAQLIGLASYLLGIVQARRSKWAILLARDEARRIAANIAKLPGWDRAAHVREMSCEHRASLCGAERTDQANKETHRPRLTATGCPTLYMSNEFEVQTTKTEPAVAAPELWQEPGLDLLREAACIDINRRDYEAGLAAMNAMAADPLDQSIRRILRQSNKLYRTPDEIREELMRSNDWASLTKWGPLEYHNPKKNNETIRNLLMSNTKYVHNPSDNTFCLRKRLP
jgi:uncharacterized protein (TIGR02391 family)